MLRRQITRRLLIGGAVAALSLAPFVHSLVTNFEVGAKTAFDLPFAKGGEPEPGDDRGGRGGHGGGGEGPGHTNQLAPDTFAKGGQPEPGDDRGGHGGPGGGGEGPGHASQLTSDTFAKGGEPEPGDDRGGRGGHGGGEGPGHA